MEKGGGENNFKLPCKSTEYYGKTEGNFFLTRLMEESAFSIEISQI